MSVSCILGGSKSNYLADLGRMVQLRLWSVSGFRLPFHDSTGQAERSAVLPSAGVVDSAGPDGLPGKDGRRVPEGRAVMDGSALVFILLPIVAISLLTGWIAMLFYVDGHPGHKTQSAVRGVAGWNSSADSRPATLPGSAPAEPARRTGVIPIPLPGPAYSRQSPDIATPGRAASPRDDAQRPAA